MKETACARETEGKGRSWASESRRGKRVGERRREKSTRWHEREMRWRQRPRKKGAQSKGREGKS